MIFATPDFGAGGLIMLVVSAIFVAALVVAAIGIGWGLFLRKRADAKGRRWGMVVIIGSVMLPISCCSGPSVIFRLTHETPPLGRYPNGVIEAGMTPDEVRARLGPPHHLYLGSWMYYLDPIEVRYFMVSFGPDGNVNGTGGN